MPQVYLLTLLVICSIIIQMAKTPKQPENLPAAFGSALAEITQDITVENPRNIEQYHQTLSSAHAAHKARTSEPFNFLDEVRRTRLTPQLPEDTSYLDAILDLEKTHFDPSGDGSGYVEGTAKHDDDFIKIADSFGRALVTAEHATAQKRDGKTKEQDDFVGSLALIIADKFNANALATIGRQTGDPNWDMEHTFKDEMRRMLLSLGCGHLAVHGSVRVTEDLLARRSLDLQIGIGGSPSETSLTVSEELMKFAKDLNLRAGVNVPFWQIRTKDYPILIRDDSGMPKTTTFAAANARTTRSYAQKVIDETTRDAAAIQIEVASTLRPQVAGIKRQKTREQSAVAVNQLMAFMKRAVDLSSQENVK